MLPTEIPERDGVVFSGWTGSCSWDNIVHDVTFTPTYIYEDTVASPTADITANGDGTSTVTLSCATEGAAIYYVIEDGKAGAEEAVEPAFLQEAESVRLDLLQADLMDFVIDDSIFDIVVTPGFGIVGGIDDVFGATGPMDDSYSFMDNATEYTGGEIVLQPGQRIVFLSSAEEMNDSAPQAASGEDAEPTYTVSVTKSTLRQYRASVEGSVILTITGDKPAFTECQFTLALYDEKGLLVDLVPVTAIVAPGSNEIRLEDLVIPTDKDCTTAKLMVWLTEGDVTPVVGVHNIVIN